MIIGKAVKKSKNLKQLKLRKWVKKQQLKTKTKSDKAVKNKNKNNEMW